MSEPIYKLIDPREWAEAMAAGVFKGSGVDVEDGYIHFSTVEQLPGTLEKWFADFDRLALVEVDADHFGSELKWEKSRGGALFPHLYDELPMIAVRTVRLLRKGDEGGWLLPDDLSS
jgi:beta-hydroxylase